MLENENNLKKKINKNFSDIPDEAWEEIVRKEPEWKFIEQFYKFGFNRSSVIVVAAGLNDYQLKGRAEPCMPSSPCLLELYLSIL